MIFHDIPCTTGLEMARIHGFAQPKRDKNHKSPEIRRWWKNPAAKQATPGKFSPTEMGIQSSNGQNFCYFSPEMMIEQEELGILVPTQLEDPQFWFHRVTGDPRISSELSELLILANNSHILCSYKTHEMRILWFFVGSLNYELWNVSIFVAFVRVPQIPDPHGHIEIVTEFSHEKCMVDLSSSLLPGRVHKNSSLL